MEVRAIKSLVAAAIAATGMTAVAVANGRCSEFVLDEKEVFTGGKLPENLDDLRLVLDVKGTKGVLETAGETVVFDIPGEVVPGKVAFDMPYSGSNQITLKRVRLTSDTAPAVTHMKDWRFVLSDEKGMPESPVFDVSLDRYATGEALLKVSLDGMLMGRKPRLESGGREWGKMLERITTPYLRLETAAGEVANLMLWNGRRQFSDPHMAKKKGTEGLTRGAKAADLQWPVRRSYVFTRLPESFTLAAGFEYYMNHPYRFNGGGKVLRAVEAANRGDFPHAELGRRQEPPDLGHALVGDRLEDRLAAILLEAQVGKAA